MMGAWDEAIASGNGLLQFRTLDWDMSGSELRTNAKILKVMFVVMKTKVYMPLREFLDFL